jgi:DNA-binding response OmpR family regulator
MKNVLVIDDDKSNRDLLKEYLTKAGYQVLAAKDGEEGINLFRNACSIDIVITDIEMPKMDGNAMAHHIRTSDKAHTRIIAITGAGDSFLKLELFDVVLQKPINLVRLVSLIETVLRKSSKH